MDKPPRRLRITQGNILFMVGVLGVAHETLVNHIDRPFLLALFAGMCGVPVYFAKGTPPPPPEPPAPAPRVRRKPPKEATDEA